MENNLVRECDNVDVPEYDFRTCDHNTYMCCWTENDGQGMQDNTVRSCSAFLYVLVPSDCIPAHHLNTRLLGEVHRKVHN